jgi:hypothetical protein
MAIGMSGGFCQAIHIGRKALLLRAWLRSFPTHKTILYYFVIVYNTVVLGAKFKRLRSRLGAPKAITAMAHNLARLVYRMLKYGCDYVDKGMEFYQQRYQQQQINWIHKKARDLGLLISFTPAPVAG